MLRHHARTFHAASLLLPRAVRDPATVLYAFCRIADDAVDVPAGPVGGGLGGGLGDGHDGRQGSRPGDRPDRAQGCLQGGPHPGWQGGRLEAVERLRERVQRAYAGQPLPCAADRSLARVVVRHAIPQSLFDALLEGLAWDAEGRRYETIEDLHAYGARVAGTVGAMMSILMGVRSDNGLARACELGVAMQLTNIARDVGEDAAMGRLYLPRRWLREAGIDPDAWLARPQHGPALAGVVQRLLDEADRLYDGVGAGVAELPLGCRPGINAARILYAEIGREVERRGCDAVHARASVPGRRKLRLLLGAALALRPDASAAGRPPLAAIAPLVRVARRPASADAVLASMTAPVTATASLSLSDPRPDRRPAASDGLSQKEADATRRPLAPSPGCARGSSGRSTCSNASNGATVAGSPGRRRADRRWPVRRRGRR